MTLHIPKRKKKNESIFMDPNNKDPVEEIVKYMHIVLPIVGAVLIFMLAAIAIVMA
jgi:hypothetical protein